MLESQEIMFDQTKTINKDMEDNSIFEVLSQLESDLKDIKTAKEQIDDVLEADSEINENLASYSQQLTSIATQLSSLNELIRSEVKDIVSKVDSAVTERLTPVFKLVSDIGDLSSEIEGNAQNIISNTTETMNVSCSKIIKSFEATTKNTGDRFSKQASKNVERLVQTTTDLKGYVTDFSDSKIEILHKIDALAVDLSAIKMIAVGIKKDVLGFVSESVQQAKNLQTANNNINQIPTNLKSHEASLQSAIKSIEEKNDKAKEELKGALRTNKKILFLVMIFAFLSIILQFVI